MSLQTLYRSPPVIAAGVFLVTLALYLVTMPRGITLEDAGLFQMICHDGGIGHPPGYPLFILSCQAFVGLPFFDESVFAANLLSALYASAACVVLYLLLKDWLKRQDVATVAALLYGLSASFWSQAIIVEVYSLSSLLFLICLWLCLRYARSGEPAVLVGLAFCYGLGLSNHWPQLGLATPALLVLLWPARERFFEHIMSRWLPISVLALLAGLLPYLSLFQNDPKFAVYGEVSDWQEMLKYISRAAYDDQFPMADWSDKWQFQRWLAGQTLQEFSMALAPLMLLGLYRSFRVLTMSAAIALLTLYLGGTTLLVLLLGFEFSDVRVAIFEPYPIVGYVAPAIWTALGGAWLIDLLKQHSAPVARLIPVAMVVVVLIANVTQNNRSDNRFAEIYGLEVLSLIPQDAVLFVEGDNGVGLIGYLHYIAGMRPDVELRSWNNLVFPNRLASPFLPVSRQAALRDAFIEAQDRPVLSTISPHRRGARAGLVIRHNVPNRYVCPIGSHDFVDYLLQLAASGPLKNGHERDLLGSLLLEYTRLHVGLVTTQTDLDPAEALLLRRLQSTFFGKIGTVETLLQLPQSELARFSVSKAMLHSLMEEAAVMIPLRADRALRAVVDEYLGRVALLEPAEPALAIAHLEASMQIYPSSANTSLCLLYATYMEQGNEAAAGALARSFEDLSCSQ